MTDPHTHPPVELNNGGGGGTSAAAAAGSYALDMAGIASSIDNQGPSSSSSSSSSTTQHHHHHHHHQQETKTRKKQFTSSSSSPSSSSLPLPLHRQQQQHHQHHHHHQRRRQLMVYIVIAVLVILALVYVCHVQLNRLHRTNRDAIDAASKHAAKKQRQQQKGHGEVVDYGYHDGDDDVAGDDDDDDHSMDYDNNYGDADSDNSNSNNNNNKPTETANELDPTTLERRSKVVDAMKHAWDSYVRYAWGHDELLPVSRASKDWVAGGGMAMTIVDSLDTLFIMGLMPEFQHAADYVSDSSRMRSMKSINTMTSVFETAIRMLGGTLSAYELSGQRALLDRAREVADVLMPAFNTPSGVPLSMVNFATGHGSNPGWTGGNALLAEMGTLQLEFRRLSHLTGDKKYDIAVTKAMDVLERNKRDDGLFPAFINTSTGRFVNDHITLGAWGDSAFEYLLKQWLLSGKREMRYLDLYLAVLDGIEKKLLHRSTPSNLLYLSEHKNGAPLHKMDHLVCFAGGMFALGAYHGACRTEADCEKHLMWGKELTRTCVETYKRAATGIGPENVYFHKGSDFAPGVKAYYLRPETIESVFVLHRVTGDPMYREWGWQMFEAIEKHCRVPGGYTGLRDVTRDGTSGGNQDNVMQSFFLAETLKYFYLLYSPSNIINLNEWVFNTEAHPLRIGSRPN